MPVQYSEYNGLNRWHKATSVKVVAHFDASNYPAPSDDPFGFA
jgi:hypothetical protein